MVGRVIVTCCVPHGRFMGFCVQFDKENAVKKEAWLEATGTFEMIEIKGRSIPAIRVTEWKIVEPGNIYIYL